MIAFQLLLGDWRLSPMISNTLVTGNCSLLSTKIGRGHLPIDHINGEDRKPDEGRTPLRAMLISNEICYALKQGRSGFGD
ncbi:MAG: hypothetical protein Fur006_00750 [Coleofasciculaceae cyanobacterium]